MPGSPRPGVRRLQVRRRRGGFGMLLRDSPYKGTASFAAAHELAQEGRGSDAEGYRAEFIELIDAAKACIREQEEG